MSEGTEEPRDVYCEQKEAKQFKFSFFFFVFFFFFCLLKEKFSAKCLDTLTE